MYSGLPATVVQDSTATTTKCAKGKEKKRGNERWPQVLQKKIAKNDGTVHHWSCLRVRVCMCGYIRTIARLFNCEHENVIKQALGGKGAVFNPFFPCPL